MPGINGVPSTTPAFNTSALAICSKLLVAYLVRLSLAPKVVSVPSVVNRNFERFSNNDALTFELFVAGVRLL